MNKIVQSAWITSLSTIVAVGIAACSGNDDESSQKVADLTQGDLVNDDDLKPIGLSVQNINLPRIESKPGVIWPRDCQKYFEMRGGRSDGEKRYDEVLSGLDPTSYVLSAASNVDFASWSFDQFPKECSRLQFKHGPDTRSELDLKLVRTDVSKGCDHSRVTLAKSRVLSPSVPDQNILYVDCAKQGSGIYLEVVATGFKLDELPRIEETAIAVVDKQVQKLDG